MIAPRCVVAIARPPLSRYASRNATASALPSSGSVAPPISSINASAPGRAADRIPARISIDDEKVERSARIACASPISVRIERKTGTRVPGPAGSGTPHCGEHREEAGGLEHDRLAAGVGTRDDEQSPVGGQLEVERHRVAAVPRGLEHAAAQRLEPPVEQGMARGHERPAPVLGDLGQPALAHLAERDPGLEAVELGELARGGAELLLPRKHELAELRSSRSISRRSSAARSAKSLLGSMTSRGSTKTVWPDPERSCTIPGTRPRADARTGRQ